MVFWMFMFSLLRSWVEYVSVLFAGLFFPIDVFNMGFLMVSWVFFSDIDVRSGVARSGLSNVWVFCFLSFFGRRFFLCGSGTVMIVGLGVWRVGDLVFGALLAAIGVLFVVDCSRLF